MLGVRSWGKKGEWLGVGGYLPEASAHATYPIRRHATLSAGIGSRKAAAAPTGAAAASATAAEAAAATATATIAAAATASQSKTEMRLELAMPAQMGPDSWLQFGSLCGRCCCGYRCGCRCVGFVATRR